MKSIINDGDCCYLCGRNGNGDPLEVHHILGGPNRRLSDEDGLVVKLCGERCHRNGKNAVHRSRETDLLLKQKAQRVWEETYGTREEFRARYGRSYL